MLFKKIQLILLFLLTSYSAWAQITRQNEKLLRWNEKYEAGVPRISAALLPVYSVDHDFAGSLALNTKFKTRRNNDYLRHSDLPVNIITNFSDKHSLVGTLHSFWRDDFVLLHVNLTYRNRIDHYWGVGQKKANNTTKDDISTKYHNNNLNTNISLNLRMFENNYLGIVANINQLTATDLAEALLEDFYILTQGTEIANTGIGLSYFYEPNPLKDNNPTNNFYVHLSALSFMKDIGNDNEYQRITFHYTHALSLSGIGGILRWQINSTNGFGDIPWTDMAHLGGRNKLPGIPHGKYRDKSATWASVEFLYLIHGWHPTIKNRHSFGLNFGGGTIYGYEKSEEIILNTVLIYRFLYQPNTDLTLNFGFADSSFGMYLGFNRRF